MQALVVNLRVEWITIAISWYLLAKTYRIRNNSPSLYRFFIYSAAMAGFTVVNLLSTIGDEKIAFLNRPSGFVVNLCYMLWITWGSYTWFRYEESVLDSNWLATKNRRILWYLPIFVYVILCLLSWKTGWIFSVDDTGSYHRGSLWILQFIFSYSYMLIAVVKSGSYVFFQNRDHKERRARRAMVVNSYVILAGCLLQILFGHSFIVIAATLGQVISYVELCTRENQEIQEYQATASLLAETKRQKEELQIALDNYKQADYDRRTDFLTGLRNRQDMFELLSDGLSGRREKITTMYMLDIDNFKNLNDTCGHSYGDTCLLKIGEALREYGKKHDIIFYRYGGEEMVGIGFGPREEAAVWAEELVSLVASLNIARTDTPLGVVTASIGYTTDNREYEKMIDRADAAMYRAKGNGKNQAVGYESMI